jgi:putative hydrolase of HD superfamily
MDYNTRDLTGNKSMIRKSLLLKLFDAAYIQRWNDRVRPVEFVELDKQAHKMVIAYFLGKFEDENPSFSWIKLIEGGLFELLQRIVLTDLKPPIFYKIKEDVTKYRRLNEWVYQELKAVLSPLGKNFCTLFRDYFFDESENINRRVLNAAHYYATSWEFDIIEKIHPRGFEMATIRERLKAKQDEYSDLEGMKQLAMTDRYAHFLDMCGQLRFQIRWANLHRVPKTSVMGHSLFVAILSYLFSLEAGACPKRCVNNYFTGLFHDLPEVLTRDIISPVKRSIEGLSDLIKEYEKQQMEQEVYSLIPETWHADIRSFTEDEFDGIVTVNNKTLKVSSDEINRLYNDDQYNPRDGELVKAADSLAAFIEASVAIRNGSTSPGLVEARFGIRNKFEKTIIAGINFGEIYADFE